MSGQTMRCAPVSGASLEYETTGEGEPVLLISPVLADGFRPLVAEPTLARQYHLITYHKRGWLGSTPAPAPVSVADHAADAAALLGHLGVDRAHVVGHSSGAAVALQLAITRPDIVHTLALLELSLLSVPSAAGFLQKAWPAFEAYAAGRHDAAVATFLSAVSGLDWDVCRDVLERRVPGATAQAIRDADTLFGVELPALGTWKFGAEEAAAVSQPVLSVLGSRTEPMWVEIAGLLRSWLPQVEECTITGAGHLLHLQRPEAVAQGLAGFLDRHRMSAPPYRAAGQLAGACVSCDTPRSRSSPSRRS